MEVVAGPEPGVPRSNVEWGAVFAGASIATAVGVILLGFGAALGLSFASPYDGEGMEPAAFAIAAGLYLLWVQVTAFFIGGYATARLRARAPGASEHEVDVRDGLHGLVTWSVGVLAAGVIAFVGIGGLGAAARTPQDQISASVSRVVERGADQSAAQERAKAPDNDPSATEARAELARKWSVIAAFISAASLLVGAVAAFYGAHSGGHHRDKNVRWEMFASRVRGVYVAPAGTKPPGGV
ncbi:MAG TPA: hypothetical protein VGO52_05060 [Hyphomonadaceae bacterium]|jgi:hypothetical protein|nr:hypothetical protein [Hyphomonadaceae bacterium]